MDKPNTSPTVRAKFTVTNKANDTIRLEPVYSGSEENKRFFEATPGGSIEMSISNVRARDAFNVGHSFYVDFTPVSETTGAKASKPGDRPPPHSAKPAPSEPEIEPVG